jgi:Protein of unknown function (DUF3892)
MRYTVTNTSWERSDDGSHEHIKGVCTSAGISYTRREVVDSIAAGNEWVTSRNGSSARIKPMDFCPAARCIARPYITTAPDHTTVNNLENLPRC